MWYMSHNRDRWCYAANAILTRSRYAGTYAAAIAGRYGWEGLGGQGMGCEWLAGLVWEGLGCVGFVYKIVEITAGSSNNGGGRVVGLLCMGRNRAGSNLTVHFNFFFPVDFF